MEKNYLEIPNKLTKLYCIELGVYFLLLLYFPLYDTFITIFQLLVNIAIILLNYKKKIKLNNVIILSCIFIAISFSGLLKNEYIYFQHFRYIIFLSTYLLTFIVLIILNNWSGYLIKVIAIVCMFLGFGGLLQYISPDLLNLINRSHMNAEQLYLYKLFQKDGIFVGFFQNPANLGFLLIFLIFMFFILWLTSKSKRHRVIYFVLFIVSYYLMILTGKRGFMLFSLIILLIITYKITEQKYKAIVPLIVVVFIAYIFLNFTEIGQVMILRTFGSEDITAGRVPAYNIMWERFSDYPLFGAGTYSTNDYIDINNGHNVYLQVLSEYGIFGLVLLLSILLINIYNTNKVLNEYKHHKNKLYLSLSMQLVFILWGLTGNPLYDGYPLFIYMVFSAISWSFSDSVVTDVHKV